MDSSLLPLFHPNGIVVIGVSTSESKLGFGVARNLSQSGFRGSIQFVGRNTGTVFGRPIHASVLEVSHPVDLAVIFVPAAACPAALQECAASGVHAAIILSAGFREAGPEGALLEKQCLELARANGIRLLGPNCIGIINTHLPCDTSFLQPPMPPAGGIGFVSQSGAFCAAIIDWSRSQAFGFSQIISLGNQADVTEIDALSALADDEYTKVIVLYMEGVSNGVRFVEVARAVSRRKPLIALKVGRTESGRKAASSHTAALAGQDAAFDAACARGGILRAATAEEMFDWACALECCPLPAGRRVAVLTDAGGPGVIAADSLEALGLSLAPLSPAARTRLSARLPASASLQNPVDMLASASPEDYASSLEILLHEPAVDSALVILPPPPMFLAEEVAAAIIPIIQASHKPVVVALLGSHLTRSAFAAFAKSRIPAYPFPERAASALAALSRRAELTQADLSRSSERPFTPIALSGTPPENLLFAYGIQVPPSKAASTPDEAALSARELGFPVVMKIASSGITHKSDVGGVLLNLADEDQVRSGYTQLMESVRATQPDALIEGVILQPHVTGGQEVIIGAVRDPQFGPLVMFGSGGIEAEALRDVAFALAPLDRAEADALIHSTWAGRRLDGFRNVPPVDRAAALDALIRLSWLVVDHPEISSIEINPLRVMSRGALALDVRRTD
jgi:acetyltransferase